MVASPRKKPLNLDELYQFWQQTAFGFKCNAPIGNATSDIRPKHHGYKCRKCHENSN
jgi:hypothetical protein